MPSLPEHSSLAHELINSATRDVALYLAAPDDPNRDNAGRAALVSLNAAVRILCEARDHLLAQLPNPYTEELSSVDRF